MNLLEQHWFAQQKTKDKHLENEGLQKHRICFFLTFSITFQLAWKGLIVDKFESSMSPSSYNCKTADTFTATLKIVSVGLAIFTTIYRGKKNETLPQSL